MAKLTDLQKAINAIKRIVGNPKMIISDNILETINSSLGFTVSIATIKENIKEQQITYETVEVDDAFLFNYINKNKKHIKKTELLNFNLTELQKFEFIYMEIISMIQEEYNADKFSISHLIANKETQFQRIAWDSLYRYIKYNVMGYDVEQLLEPKITQKIKEIQTGRILGNNKQNAICEYSYNDILLTFKFCYFDIQKAIKCKNFSNNVSKFNYICAIVKDNLNTVIDRQKAQEMANEKLLNTEFKNNCQNNLEERLYVRRTEEAPSWAEEMW